MARLPKPGGDDNQWGGILNDFLSVEHAADGTLKKAIDIATAKSTAESAVQQTELDAQVKDLVEDGNSALKAALDTAIAAPPTARKVLPPTGNPTIDTARIQAQLDAIGEDGGLVDLWSGTYVINGLTIKSSTHLRGAGREATTLQLADNANKHIIVSDSWESLYGSGTAGGGNSCITISDLTIEGNQTNQAQPIRSALAPKPTLSASNSGGSLAAGDYNYRIAVKTAYGYGRASDRADSVATITGSTGSVSLSWSSVAGATGYIIYGRSQYSFYKITEVDAGTTSWVDTGAIETSMSPMSEGNCTASAGIAVYGHSLLVRDVDINRTAGPGIVTEWVGYSGVEHTMESCLTNVRVFRAGTSSVIWRGPNDSTWVHGIFAWPSSHSSNGYSFEEDNVVIENGPVVAVACHAWANGRWAWNIRVQSMLIDCQGEGAGVGQLLCNAPQIVVRGGWWFYPNQNGCVGIQLGDAFYNAERIVLDDPHISGFNENHGPALNLTYASSNNAIAVTTDMNAGTRIAIANDASAFKKYVPTDLGNAAASPALTPAAIWTDVTLLNSWTSAPAFVAPKYTIIDGIVYLRGAMSGGWSGTVGFTLPEEARPSDFLAFAVTGIDDSWVQVLASVRISSNGNVEIGYSGPNVDNGLVLDSVSFPII